MQCGCEGPAPVARAAARSLEPARGASTSWMDAEVPLGTLWPSGPSWPQDDFKIVLEALGIQPDTRPRSKPPGSLIGQLDLRFDVTW